MVAVRLRVLRVCVGSFWLAIVLLAYSSLATWSLCLRERTHGVVGVSWHGRVCGRGFRGMVVVVHGLVDEMIVRR